MAAVATLAFCLWSHTPSFAQDQFPVRDRDWQEVPPELVPPEAEPEGEIEQQQPEAQQPAATPTLRADRISFEVPFPPEKGGGVAVGTAGNLEYAREDYVIASGGVELRFREYMFQGERVAVDLREEQITAQGDVIVDQGPRRMVGDTLFFDLKTETGTLANAKAYVDPDIFFEGREITKLGENRYRVVNGLLTSCINESPAWSIRLSRAEVELEGFARISNARFRIKRAPLLYLPYMLYPAKTERTSGFLFPNFGFSRNRGSMLGLAYFQTLGPSYDTTFYFDIYERSYYAFGNEIRYRPSDTTNGLFEGYIVDDPNDDEFRWKAFWVHRSDKLPLGLRGVVQYQDLSDFNFFRDFERDFNNATVRTLLASAYLTGSWGQQSFTLLADQRKTVFTDDDIGTTRQVPEAEYRLRATQLGPLPLYVDLLGSAHQLQSKRSDQFSNSWSRADLLPQLTASLSTLPWLSFSVTGGGRVTWYSKSLDETTGELTGDALTRTFTSASSSIVGPSFSRVFDKKLGRFSKFKHIIEPRWNYAYAEEVEDQDLIPRFDEIDRVQGANLFSYNLVNRLLAKPADSLDGGGAREIMSLELSQLFSLDDDKPFQVSSDRTRQTKDGPISLRYRFNPRQDASLEARVSHNTLFGRLNNASLSGGVGIGQHGLGLTWFTRFNPETGDTTGNQVRFFSGISILPNRLRLDTQVNYDFQQKLLQSQRYVFQWYAQCFSVRLELQEFKTASQLNREIRFALTLKNIGTFLDLTGGTQTGFNPRF